MIENRKELVSQVVLRFQKNSGKVNKRRWVFYLIRIKKMT